MNRRLRWLLAWMILLAALPATAEERILDFHSDIVVGADAGMRVTETIRVRAEGQQIEHGIYRDFPTDYRDRHGNRVRVQFQPLALSRDGVDEPFHSERLDNGVRVYFGSSEVLLPPGEHVYAFTYHTDRQLGFFADHDELYWNVTGNGWDFAIDSASASVTLPGHVPSARLELEAYTGAQGDRGRDWNARTDGDSRALFATTAMLPPRHGLTLVVGFPKGVVAAPTTQQRVAWFLGDNASVLALVAALLLVLTWYVVQWSRVGRDPRPGTIIPLYDPPTGHTPGMLRYVLRMGWDDRCVAADLVDAAVRGGVRIGEVDDEYRLERTTTQVALPAIEQALVDDLLAGAPAFTFKRSEHARIRAALQAHKDALKRDGLGRYFNTNVGLVVIGALLTLASAIGAVVLVGEMGRTVATAFILVWLGGWSMGVFTLCAGVFSAWRAVRKGSPVTRALRVVSASLITLFALPFIAGELVGLGMLVFIAGVAFAILIFALIAVNLVFLRLMKAPTALGRKLLDQIEGLRMYLGVAERDELAAQRAPMLDAAEYHRMLPWALALDVEQNWTDRFAAAVGPAAAAAAVTAAGWYRGTPITNLGSFTSGIGSSFGSAISSSSTAPGSSSGGGGGGSSGGGGGGGGGGGW